MKYQTLVSGIKKKKKPKAFLFSLSYPSREETQQHFSLLLRESLGFLQDSHSNYTHLQKNRSSSLR